MIVYIVTEAYSHWSDWDEEFEDTEILNVFASREVADEYIRSLSWETYMYRGEIKRRFKKHPPYYEIQEREVLDTLPKQE